MKIIFALHPEKGHVNPMIGTLQALQDLGHDVSVVAVGDISDQIGRAGIHFHLDLLGAAAEGPRGKDLIEFLSRRENQVEFLKNGFILAAESGVGAFETFFARSSPDLLVIDPMNYAAVIAAEKRGLPWVGISSSLTSVLPQNLDSEILKLVDLLAPRRAALFRRHGAQVRFRAIDCLSPLLQITFATEAFVGAPPDGVALVGPARPLRARGDEVELRSFLGGAPLVYVSFGSQIYHQPEIFAKIIRAGERAGVRMILSIGDLKNEPSWREEPAHCQFYEYAPQMKVLEKASLFITHGGANSVMESLVCGVPLLISPMCNDQEHQSHFIRQAGVGKEIDLRSASEGEIQEAIVRALGDEEMRSRMRQVSASYQGNGSLEAARLISDAVHPCGAAEIQARGSFTS